MLICNEECHYKLDPFYFLHLSNKLFEQLFQIDVGLIKYQDMKTNKILLALLLIYASLGACGNNNGTKKTSTDTAGKSVKADTAIAPGNQKNIKNDSVSGDPSAKGAADPNAKLPKK